jgi:hypothetical protein
MLLGKIIIEISLNFSELLLGKLLRFAEPPSLALLLALLDDALSFSALQERLDAAR